MQIYPVSGSCLLLFGVSDRLFRGRVGLGGQWILSSFLYSNYGQSDLSLFCVASLLSLQKTPQPSTPGSCVPGGLSRRRKVEMPPPALLPSTTPPPWPWPCTSTLLWCAEDPSSSMEHPSCFDANQFSRLCFGSLAPQAVWDVPSRWEVRRVH